jgi:predicted nucleic acid-binding protein
MALLKQRKVVMLTEMIGTQGAEISFDHKIPMADSIILATAQVHEATIWTLDSDFKSFSRVEFFG